MIRRITTVLLGLTILLVMASCGQSSSVKGKGKAAMVMVGLAMDQASQSAQTGESIQGRLETDGHTVELAYASSAEEQAQQVSALVEDGASVMVLQPIDSLEAAKTLSSISVDVTNVAVVACGAPISADTVDVYLGPDLFAMGQEQARQVLKQLGLETPSAAFEGDAYAVELVAGNGAQRAIEGAMDVLTPYVQSGMVTLPSGSDPETCCTKDPQAMVKGLCQGRYADSELSAVLCLGEGQANQVVDALLSNYTGAAFPVVTGYGCDETSLQYLASHLVSALCISEEADYTALVQKTVAALGEGTMEDIIVPCNTVTPENYKEQLVDTGLYTAHKGGTFTKN